MFADDTKIFQEVRCSTDCSQLQADLDKLFFLWAQKWQMEFNVEKCKVMHVGSDVLLKMEVGIRKRARQRD